MRNSFATSHATAAAPFGTVPPTRVRSADVPVVEVVDPFRPGGGAR